MQVPQYFKFVYSGCAPPFRARFRLLSRFFKSKPKTEFEKCVRLHISRFLFENFQSQYIDVIKLTIAKTAFLTLVGCHTISMKKTCLDLKGIFFFAENLSPQLTPWGMGFLPRYVHLSWLPAQEMFKQDLMNVNVSSHLN